MLFIYGFILVFLAACGQKPADYVYKHLEKAVELEEPFEQQQEPLQEAEKKENEIFQEIVALGMGEIEEISRLADEALRSIDARAAMVETEKESIEASIEEFRLIEEQAKKVEENLNEQLIKLEETMEGRYKSYHALYEAYQDALEKDRALFQMLTEEELTLEQLQSQIDLVNDSYEKVSAQKEEFNRLTSEYNEGKRSFYEAAELNVQYEQ